VRDCGEHEIMSQNRPEQGSPDRRPRIAPLLSVRNGVHALEFYRAAFGARETFRVDNEKHEVVARFSIDGADFWIADEAPEHDNFSPESLGGSTVRIVLIVDDPDATFRQAVAAGAKEVWPVADRYGWRMGRVADPFGHHWEIGKPLHATEECTRRG
jgi:PhnB protein